MLQMLMALQQWESERQKLRVHVRRLCEENAWLRDELSTSQKRLQVAEEQVATLEEQSKQLAFMHDMRQYDDHTPAQQQQQPPAASSGAPPAQQKLVRASFVRDVCASAVELVVRERALRCTCVQNMIEEENNSPEDNEKGARCRVGCACKLCAVRCACACTRISAQRSPARTRRPCRSHSWAAARPARASRSRRACGRCTTW